jgi:hypothetical protein
MLNGIRAEYIKISIKNLLPELSCWRLFVQGVSCRLLIPETQIQSHGTYCRICGGQSASQRNSIFLYQLPFHHYFMLIHPSWGTRNPIIRRSFTQPQAYSNMIIKDYCHHIILSSVLQIRSESREQAWNNVRKQIITRIFIDGLVF